MPLQDPVIDDRRYADIVREARTRIPRYTSEWTDVNESDPGFTVVELFAWLTEMQIYRMSKVPALNYLKFLELVGIELEPARPAKAEVTFPVQEGYSQPFVIVPAGTAITTEEPDEEGPIVFELDRALTALTAKLDAVQVFDGFSYKDVSLDNQEPTTSFEAFGPQANVDSALLLGFDYDQEFPNVTFMITFFSVPTANVEANGIHCAMNSKKICVSSELAWEFWNGKEWMPLNVLKDETGKLTRSGSVTIKSPSKGSMKRSPMGKIIDVPRYWIRARLTKSDYDQPPQLLAVRTNTMSVTQAETIEAEVVGGSNGRPNQVVTLASTPVLEKSFDLQIDEGEGFLPWIQVEDFFSSGREDTHFVLNRTTGEIRFGNGTNGRIPVANVKRPANFLANIYRVGGGKRGNLTAGTITALQSSLEGIDANGISNLYASYGGTNEETIDQAKARAPQVLKSRDRAVTVQDFELLTLRSANIARAKALPGHHPDFPGVTVPGVVSVIVVPDVDNAAPIPSEGTLRTVCAYLDERRLLTTEVYVLPPSYRELTISVELIAKDDADLAEVKQTAEATIFQYFHPLSGGEDSSFEQPGLGWPFGGDIYYSLVVNRLLVSGVKRVESLRITLDGEEFPPCQDIPLDAGKLLTNGAHDIQIRYDFSE